MRERSAAANPVRLCAARHAQAVPVECLDDFSGQDCLELFDVRILMLQVAEDTPAPVRHFQLFAFHRNISFNPFNRFLIRPTQRRST